MNNKIIRELFLERICELKGKKDALSLNRWNYEYKKRLQEIEFMLNNYEHYINKNTVRGLLPYDCVGKNKACELPMNSCRHCAVKCNNR